MPHHEPLQPATPRRFQFTISSMLWAMFWVAVSLGAWGFVTSPRFVKHEPSIQLIGLFGVVLGPAFAIAAIFGRTRTTLVLVAGLWLLAIVALLMLTTRSGVR